VRRFETELLQWFRTSHGDVLDAIRSSGAIPDADVFEKAVEAFAEGFQASATASGEPLGGAADPGASTVATAPTHLPEEQIEREPERPGH
jgi:hypothetical protein